MYPKKRFGQNFLTDKKLLEDLVKLIDISIEDKILEVGPGKGDLTDNLIKFCDSYYGIEIDEDLFSFLVTKFPKNKGSFFNLDILNLKLSEIVDSSNIRIIGNIPYNISSPLLDWCEKNFERIKDMHFMLQKEFALRCAGNEDSSSYGRLSVICNYLYEVTILKDVPRDYFDPKPKVDSLFVRFTPKIKKINRKELNSLKEITRALFNKKRKKISNSLRDILDDDRLDKLDLDLNLRPDHLSLKDYLKISALLK